MKYLSITLFLCCQFLNKSGVCQDVIQSASLIIKITHLRSEAGQVGISLYNKREGFPRKESALYTRVYISGWKGSIADTVFTGLPAGDYAIASYHDENSDFDMNYSFFGIPLEGYCFSNNVKPSLRPPKWEEAKFIFSGETVIQEIEMKY